MATYGVDVLDPAVTPRRISVLLDRLPPYARRPGQQWSTEAELLAVLIDHVANLTWITARAAGAKNVPRPRPIQRPRVAEPARNPRAINGPAGPAPGTVKTSSWAEAVELLAGMAGVRVTGGADG